MASSKSKSGAIVVTGGGQGLGEAFAKLAASEGYSVALIGRDARKLAAAKDKISAKSGTIVSAHACDLVEDVQVAQAFAAIAKEHGRVRALVNNAGTWTPRNAATDLTSAALRAAMELNFYSAVNATQATLKHAAAELAIVNIGATASLQGWPTIAPFCVSKSALRIYSQSLARELAPKGIHVAHLIVDGLLDNERTRKLNPEEPAERFMSLESVSRHILYLIEQERSCWTFESEVRPFNEDW